MTARIPLMMALARQCAVAALWAAAAVAVRVPDSPFPVPIGGLNTTSCGRLYLVNTDAISRDDTVTATSLQGQLSRFGPCVYRVANVSSPSYGVWAQLLAEQWGVVLDENYYADVIGLAAKFAGKLGGFILANVSDASTSAAYTVAAATNLIVATPANAGALAAAGLKQVLDVRQLDVDWALNTYNTSATAFNRRVALLQDPSKLGQLADYGVFARAINWWDSDGGNGASSPTSVRVLGSLQESSAVLGWGTSEDGVVAAVSDVGGWVHATDFANNLDVLSAFDLPRLQQPQPAPGPAPATAGMHTVCFLMSDGDNVQWLLNTFAFSPSWWGSPDRGSVPLGWTVSPAMADLGPVVLRHLYDTAAAGSGVLLPGGNASASAAGRDYFVAGPSGVGYTFPDDLAADGPLQSFANVTNSYMAKAGLRIVNIMGQESNAAAAAEYLQQPDIDAAFWYPYSDYSGLNGEISFVPVNGGYKPVIGARMQLWSGTFDDPNSLILQLLLQSRDPTTAAGYSLVPVHVWTNTVTDVRTVVDALSAAGGVQVVTPDVFVQLIQQNLAPHA